MIKLNIYRHHNRHYLFSAVMLGYLRDSWASCCHD